MGKARDAIVAFINKVPDDRLRHISEHPDKLYTDINFRLDMQTVRPAFLHPSLLFALVHTGTFGIDDQAAPKEIRPAGADQQQQHDFHAEEDQGCLGRDLPRSARRDPCSDPQGSHRQH